MVMSIVFLICCQDHIFLSHRSDDRGNVITIVSAKLKSPNTADEKFEPTNFGCYTFRIANLLGG
jgi:hypothetical protein